VYLDFPQVILQYTKDYCDRNFIMKLLMTSHDRDQYQSMVENLAQLMVVSVLLCDCMNAIVLQM
jgi:hypothetical protein